MLHLDLNIGKYDTPDSLDKILDNALSQWEAIYGTGIAETTLALRFKGILERAYKQTSERAGTALPERALHCLQLVGSIPRQNIIRPKDGLTSW